MITSHFEVISKNMKEKNEEIVDKMLEESEKNEKQDSLRSSNVSFSTLDQSP